MVVSDVEQLGKSLLVICIFWTDVYSDHLPIFKSGFVVVFFFFFFGVELCEFFVQFVS